jgi:hypothetical protein
LAKWIGEALWSILSGERIVEDTPAQSAEALSDVA